MLLGGAKLEQCAGESEGRRESQHWRGAVAELETRRQKETGGLEPALLHPAAVACVCGVGGEGGSRAVSKTGWHWHWH